LHAQIDTHISSRLKTAIALTAVTLVAEVAGGIWTNSLSLLSDAAHVFLDLFALLLSLWAISLASKPASETHSFGLHRAEVFASFINGVTILLMSLGIFCEAFERLLAPQQVDSLPMLIIAVIGLFMNLLSAKALHAHAHDDLNVHSAFLHVIGDAAASAGVIVGGAIMYFTDWYLLDALISAGIGAVILNGAWRVLRESVHILLEGVPRGLSVSDVANTIRRVDGVDNVHHLNIWTVCSHILALSVHVDIHQDRRSQAAEVVHAIEHALLEHHNISHTTIQVNCIGCSNGPIIKELKHGHGQAHHQH